MVCSKNEVVPGHRVAAALTRPTGSIVVAPRAEKAVAQRVVRADIAQRVAKAVTAQRAVIVVIITDLRVSIVQEAVKAAFIVGPRAEITRAQGRIAERLVLVIASRAVAPIRQRLSSRAAANALHHAYTAIPMVEPALAIVCIHQITLTASQIDEQEQGDDDGPVPVPVPTLADVIIQPTLVAGDVGQFEYVGVTLRPPWMKIRPGVFSSSHTVRLTRARARETRIDRAILPLTLLAVLVVDLLLVPGPLIRGDLHRAMYSSSLEVLDKLVLVAAAPAVILRFRFLPHRTVGIARAMGLVPTRCIAPVGFLRRTCHLPEASEMS